MDALKPFLMLACAAFVVGFMGYLGLVKLATPPEATPAVAAVQQPAQDPKSAEASTPTTADDWNAGKRI